MQNTTYNYKVEQAGIFDKQIRDRAIVKRDADLISCFGSKKDVVAYAMSQSVSETLVMAVWSKQVSV